MKEGASRNVLRGIIQHDTLNEVNIRLSDGSRAFDYTGYTNIIFKVLKADGTSYIAAEGESVIATSPIDGIVTVILAGQATTVAGLCQSVIEIYSGADKMTTARFNYEVFESLGVDEAAVSEDHYPVFQTLLTDLSELEANVESAEEKRVSAEAARASTASGYVARAEQAAADAEMWARAAQDIADGDYATRAELEAVAKGAAPAGFGLGGIAPYITDFNDAKTNGWYKARGGTAKNYPLLIPSGGGAYGVLFVQTRDGSVYQDARYYNYVAHRYYSDSEDKWSEWEYMNPPMLSGVEYRTTERFLGKPVYTKLINVSTVPASSTVTVDYAENVDCVVYANVYANAADQYNNEAYVSIAKARSIGVTLKNAATTDAANCLVHMKYTKTTD